MYRLQRSIVLVGISLGFSSLGWAQEIVRKGDFSKIDQSTFYEKTTASSAVDGTWVSSVKHPWTVLESGGNLGAYVEVVSGETVASRLLYVARNRKKATGAHTLSFDYHQTDSSDELGVIVFGVNKELSIGGDLGSIQMEKGDAPGMTFVEPSKRWKEHVLPIDLGDGFEYIYILFAGRAEHGQTGLDNISFQPTR